MKQGEIIEKWKLSMLKEHPASQPCFNKSVHLAKDGILLRLFNLDQERTES